MRRDTAHRHELSVSNVARPQIESRSWCCFRMYPAPLLSREIRSVHRATCGSRLSCERNAFWTKESRAWKVFWHPRLFGID